MCKTFDAKTASGMPVTFGIENCSLSQIGNKIEVNLQEAGQHPQTVNFEDLTFHNGDRSKIEATIRKKLTPVKGKTGCRDGSKTRQPVHSR